MPKRRIPSPSLRPQPVSAPTTLRGRPQKTVTDVETDTQRARGRRAQIAFQRRKNARLDALEAKCQGLESVVANMTNEFVEFSGRLMNSGQVGKETMRDVEVVLGRLLALGKQAAGVLEEEPSVQPFLVTPSGGANDNSQMQSGPFEDLEDQGLSQPASTTPWIDLFPATSEAFPFDQPRGNPYQENIEANINMVQNKPFDPYSNYLWQPKDIPTTNTSIIPYIMAGRDSFASRLYYQTISHAVRSLQGDGPWDIAANMFRFKLMYASKEAILGVMAGILEMLLLGTNQIKGRWIPQQDIDNDDEVRVAILEMVGKENEKDYLSSWEVERYLTGRWALGVDSNAVRVQLPVGEDASAHLTAAILSTNSGPRIARIEEGYRKTQFAPTVIPGFFWPDQIIMNAEPLLDLLRAETVTLGEGPRWHRASIDRAVRAFLQQGTYHPRISH